jgi:transcriptional antiterminator RfaH
MSYWAAAQLQPQREQLALYFLEHAGFEVYSPRVREHRWRYKRRVEVVGPLFPGYCFVSVELQWRAAHWCPGVIRLVMDGLQPAHVSDGVIAAIRQREHDGVVDLRKPLKIGDEVRIVSGALIGRLGIFAGMAPHERVMVLLELLGAHRRVKLRRDAIEPI